MTALTKRPFNEVCQLCDESTADKPFVDGRTRSGPWANMCLSCFITEGRGLGVGFGQLYAPDGKKIAYAAAREYLTTWARSQAREGRVT